MSLSHSSVNKHSLIAWNHTPCMGPLQRDKRLREGVKNDLLTLGNRNLVLSLSIFSYLSFCRYLGVRLTSPTLSPSPAWNFANVLRGRITIRHWPPENTTPQCAALCEWIAIQPSEVILRLGPLDSLLLPLPPLSLKWSLWVPKGRQHEDI